MSIRNADDSLKRMFDIIAASLGLVLLAPLGLCIAVVVKLNSPGPALFKHKRLGKNRRPFSMLKFRTMVTNASGLGPEFTVAKDSRVTGFGRVLRKTKLDELPQLINVLKGEMSLVGPRPQSLSLAEHYADEALDEILSVRPGITGPTQLWLRHEEELLARQANPEDFYITRLLPLKIESDRHYVKRRSIAEDAKIMSLTVRAVASFRVADSETAEICQAIANDAA